MRRWYDDDDDDDAVLRRSGEMYLVEYRVPVPDLPQMLANLHLKSFHPDGLEELRHIWGRAIHVIGHNAMTQAVGEEHLKPSRTLPSGSSLTRTSCQISSPFLFAKPHPENCTRCFLDFGAILWSDPRVWNVSLSG
jgi:hypothetical protein